MRRKDSESILNATGTPFAEVVSTRLIVETDVADHLVRSPESDRAKQPRLKIRIGLELLEAQFQHRSDIRPILRQ